MNNMQTIVNNEIKNQREYMDIQRKRIVELNTEFRFSRYTQPII